MCCACTRSLDPFARPTPLIHLFFFFLFFSTMARSAIPSTTRPRYVVRPAPPGPPDPAIRVQAWLDRVVRKMKDGVLPISSVRRALDASMLGPPQRRKWAPARPFLLASSEDGGIFGVKRNPEFSPPRLPRPIPRPPPCSPIAATTTSPPPPTSPPPTMTTMTSALPRPPSSDALVPVVFVPVVFVPVVLVPVVFAPAVPAPVVFAPVVFVPVVFAPVFFAPWTPL